MKVNEGANNKKIPVEGKYKDHMDNDLRHCDPPIPATIPILTLQSVGIAQCREDFFSALSARASGKGEFGCGSPRRAPRFYSRHINPSASL
jgi:hypothetical protein